MGSSIDKSSNFECEGSEGGSPTGRDVADVPGDGSAAGGGEAGEL